MIMTPVLIMLIFLLPFSASLITNGWADSRRTLLLQETAGSLSSSMQQLYSSLGHESVKTGVVTCKLNAAAFIEGYAYVGNATLRNVIDPDVNSSKILDVTLSFIGTNGEAKVSVTLGNNAEWESSTLVSNSTSAGINGEKLSNGMIRLSFSS
jgi:hypothetical protein